MEFYRNTKEDERLKEHHERKANWRLWGPYLSDRAWGTVREDYGDPSDPWNYFPHDHARSRAYRWNEDGLGGISDRNQYLCFAHTFWNGKDPILKERFFGLSNPEGNHGEDVKEYYFHLDNTPTHSYMKMLYKYPQGAFPYTQLVEGNKNRSLSEPEFELLDTGIFDEGRYFDIFIEYAKAKEDDILIQLEVHNRGPSPAFLALLPTLWFRNTWSWGYPKGPMGDVPTLPLLQEGTAIPHVQQIEAHHPTAGRYILFADGAEELLFTENETNKERIFQQHNATPFVKDAFHRYLVGKEKIAVNREHKGTKGAFLYQKVVEPGEVWKVRLRLSRLHDLPPSPFADFDSIFALRKQEADEFYHALQNKEIAAEENLVQRQALAGMLWSKQLYYYDVEQWRRGDPVFPNHRKDPVPLNHEWDTLVNFDVLSMPDKWEYPWYASWDLAFHCVSLVLVDPDFAKRQLTLIAREWYMHPNGQIPAYEWNFSDSNPPVIAWAAWRVYKIDARQHGRLDLDFLSGIFHKLLINFTWWINRKDIEGHNIFEGGFLGLDNISLFDRSLPLPTGGNIYQSDATAWIAFYCIVMMKIAIELGRELPVYENLASKFFEHFLRVAGAMVNCGGKGYSLWDPEDRFFYDVISEPSGAITHLKIRSMVGLLPLLAVETSDAAFFADHPLFKSRTEWFLNKHPHFRNNIASLGVEGDKRLLAILSKERLVSVLKYMLDENEFLSDYGIRSLSKYHEKHPYSLVTGGQKHTIGYEPNTANSRLFGGNSNWRGPVWMPLNFLIIESLQKFHYFYRDSLKVECPTGSGNWMTLWEVSTELSRRLISLFLPGKEGKIPSAGKNEIFFKDPYWSHMTLFYEYFGGDTGIGLGASHQTGWTGLVAKLVQQSGRPDVRTWRRDSKNFKKER